MGSKLLSLILIVTLSISTLTYGNVSAEDPVRITGHKKYIDSSGLLHIIGTVENFGTSPVGLVRITASFLDEQGNPLPSYDALTLVRTLLPGYVTPFDIPVSDRSVGMRIDSYTLSLSWGAGDPKPENFNFSEINAFTVTHWDPRTVGYMGSFYEGQNHSHHANEQHAHTETSGYLTNSGDTITRSVKVAVIWYDRQGEFYGYDSQVVSRELAIGENAKWVFMIHPKAMGYYTLVVESDSYVGVLKENGERLIPVYEAVETNMNVAELSAISISQVTLVDESNQPLSNVESGKMVFLQSVMKNNLGTKQKFLSIYQIKDSSGTPVMLFWMSSQIPALESLDTAISWIPEQGGTYTLQIFLWESLSHPVPVGDFSESTITVSA
jgi:hypothetical protein